MLGKLADALAAHQKEWLALDTLAKAKARWAKFSKPVEDLKTEAEWKRAQKLLSKSMSDLQAWARQLSKKGQWAWVLGAQAQAITHGEQHVARAPGDALIRRKVQRPHREAAVFGDRGERPARVRAHRRVVAGRPARAEIRSRALSSRRVQCAGAGAQSRACTRASASARVTVGA